MPLGSRKGHADLKKANLKEAGKSKGSAAGRKFAKENGRKLVVNLQALDEYNKSGLVPMTINLKALDES